MLKLRYYQEDAINATLHWFEENDGNPLIVLPTGTGKALLCARLAQIVTAYPGSRVLIVTHVQELVLQNYQEMIALWPDAPAGVYSASLGRRDLGKRVTFASIQSIFRRSASLPKPDIIIVDEAHLIPRNAETMYGQFLAAMKIINPSIRVVGLTATPYRMDSGRLDEGDGRIFTAISYEYSIKQAMDDGYLSPLISKDTRMHLDTTGVGTRGGEFIAGELQDMVDTTSNNVAAVDETIAYGRDRQSWLFFCSGVEHAIHIRDLVRARGFTCEAISAETPKVERARALAEFKAGRIRALASMNILTTGFNAPAVDLIAMLRPTKSASLYIQMAGRGTRLHPGKMNCLVLDFAGNVQRFGPIDAVNVKKPGDGNGEAPFKVCPECSSILHAAALKCPDCGYDFPKPEPKVKPTAFTDPIMSNANGAEWRDVESISYTRHEKASGGPPTFRVTYFGPDAVDGISEWLCFEHPSGSFAHRKAANWWIGRGGAFPVPTTVAEALSRKSEIGFTTQILAKRDGKYFTVIAHRKGAVRDVLEASSPPRLQPEPAARPWS